jgi:curved DNA-binding protein
VHPDQNASDPQAEAKFKELNEAYEVLSDPQKRRLYDTYGSAGPGVGASGGTGQGSPFGGASGSDFSEIFDTFFSNRGRGSGRSTRGRGTRVESNPFGGFGGFDVGTSYSVDGSDIAQPVTITLHEAYTGATRLITKGGRTLRANIPPGAQTGTRVRLAGEGEPGINGGQPGDLYLVVEVEPDPQFERKGDDLIVEVKVDWATAMLGGEVEVPTLSRPLKLRIPPGTQSGRRLRLAGKGMPLLKQPNQHGDLYARVLITIPETLTDEQRALVEQLRRSLQA